MNVLIVEDELPAAEKLERYLSRYDPGIAILEKLDSVSKSVSWLKTGQDKVDLIFMDIQLIDGLSFDIFKEVTIEKPIIFTTAFNEYALEAFKVNSVDYLLKPITYRDLEASLEKFKAMKSSFQDDKLDQLGEVLAELHQKKSYKNRFMVKLGDHIKSVTTDQISVFFADGRNVTLVTREGRKFIIDFKMEELEGMLDPKQFFRANRTFIVHIDVIKDVIVYSNSRLRISVDQELEKEIIVSREKVSQFKIWFDG